MDSDFDLESLVHLEQIFYNQGFTDGFAHGKIHGLIEGRALGREKGFEMWEELGFYEGFAKGWKATLDSGLVGKGNGDTAHFRAIQHIHHLLELISQFPCVNPSSASTLKENNKADIDISKLQRQIRSRYKALCSCLGVRPRIQAASESDTSLAPDGEEKDIDTDVLSGSQSDYHRAAPGSFIPVWKVDQTSGIRTKVTNMDLSY